jgi:hypothetical protein
MQLLRRKAIVRLYHVKWRKRAVLQRVARTGPFIPRPFTPSVCFFFDLAMMNAVPAASASTMPPPMSPALEWRRRKTRLP